jgi:pimeloyl-ACP methyl ester carboxylesterase
MFAHDSYPILREVYPNSSASSRKSSAGPDEVERLLTSLGRYALGCMPMLPQENHPWYKNKWFWRLASGLVFSFDDARYAQVCYDDLDHTMQLMTTIAQASEERWPLEVKAFMLHHLLSHVVAYRPADFFYKNPHVPVMLPVRRHGQVSIRNCRFDQEVELFGGVMAKIFVPQEGHGSATYLFSGTTPWTCADGAGITLLDDFNPLGPGEGLRRAARKRLVAPLKQHLHQLGEPAMVVGHSLGAILATYLAVDLPHYITQAIVFNPTRPSHRAAGEWTTLQSLVDRALSAGGAVTPQELREEWRRIRRSHQGDHLPNLPKIDTFVSHFADHWDLVSYIGARWIGNVHRVHSQRKADFIQRHLMPTGACLGGVAEISRLDTDEANSSLFRRTPWHAAIHAVVVLPIALVLLLLIVIKRFLIGWNRGGIWRRGILSALTYWLSKIYSREPRR